MKLLVVTVLIGLMSLLLAACKPDSQPSAMNIRVIVDGKELVFSVNDHTTVLQFLQQANIQLGELDKVNPNEVTQLTDNMVITIIRVREDQVCEDQSVPYETKYLNDPDLAPGTTKIMQPGTNGKQQVCAMVTYEDGVEKNRTAGHPTITVQPSEEIVARGVDKTKIEPVPIAGNVVYISDGQARIIEGNSVSDRMLPTGGNLDGKVFSLSPTGKQLLFTRQPDKVTNTTNATGTPVPDTYNQLWILLDVSDAAAQPIRLTTLDNILAADWIPDQPFTFSYSTLQPRQQAPGYQALNDLYIARLNSLTGSLLNVKPVIKSRPTGVFGVWGTEFRWSPNGKMLAWAQADGVGIVDMKEGMKDGTFKKLFDFRVYSTTLSRNWVWIPELSWSPASDLLAATVHGKPLYGEEEETSPVFDIALTQANNKTQGLFQITLVSQAGMWATPQYSPLIDTGIDLKKGYIAYLKARNPIDSATSEYDVVIADRDGSNSKVLFPGSDKPGIKPIDTLFGNEITWSGDGRQIAIIYQGNIWIIDVDSGHANQVTVVDNAHHVRWGK